jgi:hypothetical protein
LQQSRIKISESIINDKLDPKALYFFENDNNLWNIAISHLDKSDLAGIKDSFRFIAPNFRKTSYYTSGKIQFIPAISYFDCNINEKYPFNDSDFVKRHAICGWSGTEPWGTWSDSDSSLLMFQLPHTCQSDINLLIEGHAFINEKHPSLDVDVYLKDHYLTTLKYTLAENKSTKSIKIPKKLIIDSKQLLPIRFNYRGPKSPEELGVSTDSRRLGLGLLSVEFQKEN